MLHIIYLQLHLILQYGRIYPIPLNVQANFSSLDSPVFIPHLFSFCGCASRSLYHFSSWHYNKCNNPTSLELNLVSVSINSIDKESWKAIFESLRNMHYIFLFPFALIGGENIFKDKLNSIKYMKIKLSEIKKKKGRKDFLIFLSWLGYNQHYMFYKCI